jgi:hypothetical protein
MAAGSLGEALEIRRQGIHCIRGSRSSDSNIYFWNQPGITIAINVLEMNLLPCTVVKQQERIQDVEGVKRVQGFHYRRVAQLDRCRK